MAGSKRVRTWSNNLRFYSTEFIAEGCHRAKVIIMEEYLAFFFVPEKLDSSCCEGRLLVFYVYHIDVPAGIHIKLVSYGGH